MKRECILSENELNKKRKIIQRNKIKKILNEAEQLSRDEMEALDHGKHFFTFEAQNHVYPIRLKIDPRHISSRSNFGY